MMVRLPDVTDAQQARQAGKPMQARKRLPLRFAARSPVLPSGKRETLEHTIKAAGSEPKMRALLF